MKMSQGMLSVFVISVESLDEFYVGFNDLKDDFANFDRKFQQEYSEVFPMPATISLNHLYATKNPKDQQWYRVKAKKIIGDDRIEVFYIDFGQTKIIQKSQLKQCCNPLFKISGRAMKCSLFISDKKAQIMERDDINFLFKFLVSKRQPFEIIVQEVVNSKLIVDLITIDRVQRYSVADVLMSVVGITKNPSVSSMKIKTIPSIKIKDNTPVKITQVNSPFDFYVNLITLEQDEVVIRDEMTEFHQQNRLFFTHLAVGVMCAVQDVYGIWHRAEVLDPPGEDGSSKVRLIDSGKVTSFAWSELFELNEQFYTLPKYAVHCSIAGVEPISGEWSKEALNFFKCCLTHKGQQFEISPSVNGIELSVLYDGIVININQLLINMKFAKATNIPFQALIKNVGYDQKSEKLHRVKIVNSKFNPLRFRVKFLDYNGAIEKMSESIERQLVEKDCTWVIGDKCIVAFDKKWHRGKIIDIKQGTAEGIKAVVSLIDHGTFVEVLMHKLCQCPQEFLDIEDTVKYVQLACNNRSWNESELKMIQEVIKQFNNFYITFKDNNNILFATASKPRPVTLWGAFEGGAKHNIISELEANGLVESIYWEKTLLPKGVEDWTPQDYIREAALLEARANLPPTQRLDGRTVNIGEYAVTMKKQTILDWLPAMTSMKTKLIGLATTVDLVGNIVLHDVCNKELFEKMKKIINDNFKRPSSKFKTHQFKIGDPCLVSFENDGLYYRGKIIELNGEDCIVEFIDYGNRQKGKTRHLIPHVIFSEIPPLALRYRLEGSPVKKDGKIDQKLLNMLHVLIVDKDIKVQVVPDDWNITDPKVVKRCWIFFEDYEIRNYNGIKDIVDTN